ncbi:MAG: hypothetical protein V8R13_00070 [Coprococcus sp.]
MIGFPTILNAWGAENWRKPDLYDDQELHQVELRLWMVSLMPIECTEYLYNVFGKDYQLLQAEEQIILSTAYLEEKVSNTRLQSVLNLSSIEVTVVSRFGGEKYAYCRKSWAMDDVLH